MARDVVTCAMAFNPDGTWPLERAYHAPIGTVIKRKGSFELIRGSDGFVTVHVAAPEPVFDNPTLLGGLASLGAAAKAERQMREARRT